MRLQNCTHDATATAFHEVRRRIQPWSARTPSAQRVLLAYWCVFAVATAVEVPADAALSWLPLYGETKLALLLWLLTPQFAGAVLLYRGPLTGWLRRHQDAIEHGLQHAHLQYGVWALAALLRGTFGLLITLARAAWLLAPAHAQTVPAQPPPPPPQYGTAVCPAWPEVGTAAAGSVPVRPSSGRPAPLDTAQVTLLSAGLEESCAMLLRTALAAQAGNQLLASLQSQAAVLGQPPPGTRKRHSRRRTISAAAAAVTTTGPSERGRSESPPESSEASAFGTPPTAGPPDRQ
ncbi:Receptor expression-enhancing protein 4 [Amphibalanus amphitrite]|uniref:Receptor expression-enhancing protein n=1 Tax=Amphibalanus amphitrite TaxID=1232801 RepID=A0A6A4WBG5_AMPAM|nr:Receptor expression-enhancing protein 4 [Amphibalanus amphitrite]